MRHLDADQLRALMPIQPPFLFLDQATLPDDAPVTASAATTAPSAAAATMATATATARYRITGDEFFLRGHFKGNPVLPASIMLEALGQLGVLYLLTTFTAPDAPPPPPPRVRADSIYFASSDGIRCHRVCRPGDELLLTLKPRRVRAPLATFGGAIHVGTEKAVTAEEITLTFAVTP
ncbi:3-hydroxyacyl-ACP dehydratase [Opitutaceae bacterium TAV4]|nr:3-hydroxyacyl-ACP dehydratase [Opitutaceae bacterium TAV4]